MLSATGGRYPRFVIWENVPGALSSHGGKDFEIVLNELLHLRDFAGGGTDKPIRQHGKWAKAVSYGAVAYRIVNAQYWGIPHRRRRIYAVCDTRGESATMVTFERGGTEWHFRPRLPEGGQTVACLAPDCYSWHDRMVEAGKLRGGAERAYTLKIRQGCEGGGKGPLVQTELSATLATRQDQVQVDAGYSIQHLKRLRNVALLAFGRGMERLPECPALLSRAYNVRETLPRADAWVEGDILL